MEPDLIPARRYETRPTLRRPAECRIGEKTWKGTVHDLTPGGAFFQPELCLTDGESLAPEDAWMVAGGREPIVLCLDEHAARVLHHGTVRWSGCSDVHHCGGLGVRFDR